MYVAVTAALFYASLVVLDFQAELRRYQRGMTTNSDE
jgi:hypothetical protein